MVLLLLSWDQIGFFPLRTSEFDFELIIFLIFRFSIARDRMKNNFIF